MTVYEAVETMNGKTVECRHANYDKNRPY
jgi:hypothetical protein